LEKHKRIEILQKLKKPEVCVERAILITKAYKELEEETAIIKRAKALETLLSNMSIYIQEDELIVGNLASKPFSAPIYPEYSWKWILDQMDYFETREGDKFYISEENKKILRDLLPWWKGKSVEERALALMPEYVKKAKDSLLISMENVLTGAIGHFIPNYEKIIKKGFNGIKNEVKKKIDALNITNPDDFKKLQFYRAVIICCDSIINFAKRYSKLAKELAEKTENPNRKKELLKIAEVCDWVPANPARNFIEALQSFWFTHLVAYIFHNGLAVTAGRFDQYMYPFYKKDLERGIITREEAKKWLESLWIKFNEIIKLYNNLGARLYSGFPITQAPQIGGLDEDGRDATNELSELILEVEAEVSLPQPDLAVLYHKKMKDEFLMKACKIIPLAMKPKFFNVEVGMKHLISFGASIKEARNYAFDGCVESEVPGKTWGWHNAGLINLAKCLELVLNNGVDPITKERIGIETGDPRSFKSFDEFKEAFKKQVTHAIKLLVIAIHAIETAHKELVPLPFESILVDDCIEKGIDLHNGGAKYNLTGIQAIGLATVADSLMVIKKLVYEEKALTMEELLEALNNNFQSNEELRQMLLNKVPKFGNDIDEVDELASEILLIYCNEVKKYKNMRGGYFNPGAFSISAHVALGKAVGATPDGRKAGEPLSDACSPAQGRCRNGPTAVYKSLLKLNHEIVTNGTLLNMKFNVSSFKGEENIKRFVNLLRAYMDSGGFHVQFNVIDPKVLEEAKENPEKYPDLLVRVAAYVALFSQLGKEVQEEIISRSMLE
jgi:formate C-acetyltransferase